MKTRTDPRHKKRREAVRLLFSHLFNKDQYFDPAVKAIIDNLGIIDKEIVASAPEWPLERINKIDLSILRLAVYELLIKKTEPPKVIIDEAVELGKEFGSENSAPFVNGVLGDVWKKNDLKSTSTS